MKVVKLSHIGILVLLSFLAIGQVDLSTGVVAQDARVNEVFLPMVVGHPQSQATNKPTATLTARPTQSPTATPRPTSTPKPDPNCDLLSQEAEVAQRMRSSQEQQRPFLSCNPVLAAVARARARDMAERGYFSHVNPDGYGPNYLVRKAGYPLPAYYDTSDSGNNIESIGAGYPNVSEVWSGWMSSTSHRIHLLGTYPFFAEQIEYGVGYHYDPNSPYRHYWVVLTAYQGQ